MTDVRIHLLGPLTVSVDGAERELPKSRKTRALLAMLALEPQPHQRTTLCDWIWPDTADPRGALRWSLTKLREVLADGNTEALVSTRESVSLDTDRVHTDIGDLQQLLSATEPDLEALVDIERRFERSPLPELDIGASSEFELWLESQRSAMLRLQQRLLEVLIARLIDRGDAASLDQALDHAHKRVTLDPFDNQANADLLRLLYRRRGRDEAREALERMRRRLLDAGIPDTDLLANWRKLASTVEAAVAAPAELAAPAQLIETLDTPELPSRPSVAVLAFEDLGGHESGGVLAEGISLDLCTRLSQLRGLFVVARGSTRRFSLNEHDARTIGTRLGVRYLVSGSTQRTADRIRVTANLIEADHGNELWSERFDRPLGDLFEVQDDLADAIVSALGPQIDQAEMDRVVRLPTENLDAWECFHRAMWHSYRFTADDNELAHGFFQRALLQDAHFARAYAGLSFNHFSRAFLHATDDVPGEVARAIRFGEQAVQYDGRDAMSHWSLGRARFLNREHDAAIVALDRSLLANPNYAQGHYARGYVGTHAALMDQVIGDLDMAQRLSPFDPMLFAVVSARGISLTLQGRTDEGADCALRATREPNAHFHIHAVAAACLELAGRHQAAVAKIRDVLALKPDYCIAQYERSFPFKDDAHRRIMSEALQRAGLR